MEEPISQEKIKEGLKILEIMHGGSTMQRYKSSSRTESAESSGKMEAYEDCIRILSALLENKKPTISNKYSNEETRQLIRISREQREEHGPEVGKIKGGWLDYEDDKDEKKEEDNE